MGGKKKEKKEKGVEGGRVRECGVG